MALWLLPKKHLLLFVGLMAAFVVPMFKSGELSVGKLAEWAMGSTSQQANDYGSPSANRSSQFGGFYPNDQSFPGGNSAASASTEGTSLSKFIQSIFQTQSIDANGNVIAIPGTSPANGTPSNGIPSQFAGFPSPLSPSNSNLLPPGLSTQGLSTQGLSTQGLSTQGLSTQGTDSFGNSNLPTNPTGNQPGNQGNLVTNQPWNAAVVNQSNIPFGQVDPLTGQPVTPNNTIPVFDLREIIRFDVSPQWVQQRWVRTSAAIQTPEGFQGLRVALVAGTGTVDITGALTYFFDFKNTVQRIQFQGTTANTQAIQRLLSQYFQFLPVADRPDLFAPVSDAKACGMLRFQVPVVINPNQPPAPSLVAFEINSTKGDYQLSEQFRQIALR